MSESTRLFQKADMLLGRYRGESMPHREPDFPILTEVVEPRAAQNPPHPDMPAPAPEATFTSEDLHEIETRLAGQVGQIVAGILGETLCQAQVARAEEILRQALQETVEAIQAELRARVTDLVSDALRAEIRRLRESRAAGEN